MTQNEVDNLMPTDWIKHVDPDMTQLSIVDEYYYQISSINIFKYRGIRIEIFGIKMTDGEFRKRKEILDTPIELHPEDLLDDTYTVVKPGELELMML